jgi:hypothetical protein
MERTTRRFGLGDLLILIAAICVAMMGLRGIRQGLTEGLGAGYWHLTPVRLTLATALSACAMPLTLACLAFRLRRPRPSWRRIALNPGTAAMTVCVIFFAIRAVEVGLSLALPDVSALGTIEMGRISPIQFNDGASLVLVRSVGANGVIGRIEAVGCHGTFVASLSPACGRTVAAVWLVIALAGRWKAERSWIDRLGRVLGVVWIVVSMLAAVPVLPK